MHQNQNGSALGLGAPCLRLGRDGPGWGARHADRSPPTSTCPHPLPPTLSTSNHTQIRMDKCPKKTQTAQVLTLRKRSVETQDNATAHKKIHSSVNPRHQHCLGTCWSIAMQSVQAVGLGKTSPTPPRAQPQHPAHGPAVSTRSGRWECFANCGDCRRRTAQRHQHIIHRLEPGDGLLDGLHCVLNGLDKAAGAQPVGEDGQ